MKEIISEAIKNKTLCAIYTDASNSETFSVGYFLNCDNDYALIEAFSEYGKSDGVWCYKIDDVFRIEQNTQYLRDLLKLINYHNSRINLKINFNDKILQSFLQYIIDNKLICTLQLGNDCFAEENGFVEEIISGEEGDYVKIASLDNYAQCDGYSTVYFDDIHYASCNSLDNTKLQILLDLKK